MDNEERKTRKPDCNFNFTSLINTNIYKVKMANVNKFKDIMKTFHGLKKKNTDVYKRQHTYH